MVECIPSAFLVEHRPLFGKLINKLTSHYEYVSILGTDDSGVAFRATRGETGSSDPSWVQRGILIRAQHSGKVVELAFNDLISEDPQALASTAMAKLDALFALGGNIRSYASLPDERASGEYIARIGIDPFAADPESMLLRLAACRDALQAKPDIASAQCQAEFVRVSRCFLSPNRDLFQTFDWAQAYLFGVIRKGDQAKTSYRACSGRMGAEILDLLEAKAPELAGELAELLEAGRVEPGEYEVILTPDVSGTLAHEAFGHGVETDMFVKGRAKAREYMGKAVASPIVTMYDGAAEVDQTGSFLFDDEGNLGKKTTVIDRGKLVSGFSDALSALSLGIPPTGNGRRQAYDHKAYARMTNTYFASGTSTFEDMVSSIKHGWLLDRLNSGMEDPKNWGIQLITLVGREIRDGKLTGKVVSPVFCSGYVPDVLSAISMVSKDFELSGSGACGKGYKEYVKVSAGGPYVKTRMRLG